METTKDRVRFEAYICNKCGVKVGRKVKLELIDMKSIKITLI